MGTTAIQCKTDVTILGVTSTAATVPVYVLSVMVIVLVLVLVVFIMYFHHEEKVVINSNCKFCRQKPLATLANKNKNKTTLLHCLEKKLMARKSQHRLLPFDVDETDNIWNFEYTDFISCDYLSISRDEGLCKLYMAELTNWYKLSNINPMGFNLGRGNISVGMKYPEDIIWRVEKQIADYHNAEKALMFKSGAEANYGFFGSVPRDYDVVILDELAHMSMKMGVLLSKMKKKEKRVILFKHNNISDLCGILKQLRSNLNFRVDNIIIGVDSIYSMDGDFAPVVDILKLCEMYDCYLFVDEAHSSGVYGADGKGLVCELQLDSEPRIIARLISCSKVVGSSGSVIIGSKILYDYLGQYANSHIFSHVLAPACAIGIECVYKYYQTETIQKRRHKVNNVLVPFFILQMKLKLEKQYHSSSTTFIQYIRMEDAEMCKTIAANLRKKHKLVVHAANVPLVPKDQGRIRILLHAHNTKNEVIRLLDCVKQEIDGFLPKQTIS